MARIERFEEVRAQLYVAADVGYLSEPESQRLIEQCQRISRLIGGLITYLQKPT
ncbi:MAG: four helix bundle protein [Chloroflexi bacterium]|nr:four helix bundle protein [Chloroflexota bacterium]